MNGDGQQIPPSKGGADPDLPLVRAIAEGDAAAFRQLLERHLDRVVRVAARFLQNQAEAEEVAQDVFARVWQHAGSWRSGNARYTTWLHRVAVNLCRDRLRRRREVTLDVVEEMPSDAPSADKLMQEQSVAKRVRLAIAQLPERQQVAIILCHYEGLGNKEASVIMDVSVEALESLLARGRRALKKALMKEKSQLMGEE